MWSEIALVRLFDDWRELHGFEAIIELEPTARVVEASDQKLGRPRHHQEAFPALASARRLDSCRLW
ncbi:hypothetical protein P9139_17960 [Curtobacterium flaccumfaciens]|nr:hypothetical protein P9139_17960 [Curtobacterium flaccumfaciens]